MKNIIYLLLVVILFTACKPQKVIVERYYTKDSTSTKTKETIYRDTNITVNLPKQEITVIDTNIYYNSISQPVTSQKLTAETDYAKAYSQIIQGRLQLQIENKDSAKIYIKNAIKEVFESEIKNIVEKYSEKKQVEVTTNELTWWQKFIQFLGYILLIVIIFSVVYLLLKIKSKIK